MSRTRTPVVAGWFTEDAAEEDFRLLGTRCSGCRTVHFPREDGHCRNPVAPAGVGGDAAVEAGHGVVLHRRALPAAVPRTSSDPDTPWTPVHRSVAV
ncbi:Rubredoxin-like zinc ribbon domain, partial [Streptomyces sp. Termitarium-T10T-6]